MFVLPKSWIIFLAVIFLNVSAQTSSLSGFITPPLPDGSSTIKEGISGTDPTVQQTITTTTTAKIKTTKWKSTYPTETLLTSHMTSKFVNSKTTVASIAVNTNMASSEFYDIIISSPTQLLQSSRVDSYANTDPDKEGKSQTPSSSLDTSTIPFTSTQNSVDIDSTRLLSSYNKEMNSEVISDLTSSQITSHSNIEIMGSYKSLDLTSATYSSSVIDHTPHNDISSYMYVLSSLSVDTRNMSPGMDSSDVIVSALDGQSSISRSSVVLAETGTVTKTQFISSSSADIMSGFSFLGSVSSRLTSKAPLLSDISPTSASSQGSEVYTSLIASRDTSSSFSNITSFKIMPSSLSLSINSFQTKANEIQSTVSPSIKYESSISSTFVYIFSSSFILSSSLSDSVHGLSTQTPNPSFGKSDIVSTITTLQPSAHVASSSGSSYHFLESLRSFDSSLSVSTLVLPSPLTLIPDSFQPSTTTGITTSQLPTALKTTSIITSHSVFSSGHSPIATLSVTTSHSSHAEKSSLLSKSHELSAISTALPSVSKSVFVSSQTPQTSAQHSDLKTSESARFETQHSVLSSIITTMSILTTSFHHDLTLTSSALQPASSILGITPVPTSSTNAMSDSHFFSKESIGSLESRVLDTTSISKTNLSHQLSPDINLSSSVASSIGNSEYSISMSSMSTLMPSEGTLYFSTPSKQMSSSLLTTSMVDSSFILTSRSTIIDNGTSNSIITETVDKSPSLSRSVTASSLVSSQSIASISDVSSRSGPFSGHSTFSATSYWKQSSGLSQVSATVATPSLYIVTHSSNSFTPSLDISTTAQGMVSSFLRFSLFTSHVTHSTPQNVSKSATSVSNTSTPTASTSYLETFIESTSHGISKSTTLFTSFSNPQSSSTSFLAPTNRSSSRYASNSTNAFPFVFSTQTQISSYLAPITQSSLSANSKSASAILNVPNTKHSITSITNASITSPSSLRFMSKDASAFTSVSSTLTTNSASQSKITYPLSSNIIASSIFSDTNNLDTLSDMTKIPTSVITSSPGTVSSSLTFSEAFSYPKSTLIMQSIHSSSVSYLSNNLNMYETLSSRHLPTPSLTPSKLSLIFPSTYSSQSPTAYASFTLTQNDILSFSYNTTLKATSTYHRLTTLHSVNETVSLSHVSNQFTRHPLPYSSVSSTLSTSYRMTLNPSESSHYITQSFVPGELIISLSTYSTPVQSLLTPSTFTMSSSSPFISPTRSSMYNSHSSFIAGSQNLFTSRNNSPSPSKFSQFPTTLISPSIRKASSELYTVFDELSSRQLPISSSSKHLQVLSTDGSLFLTSFTHHSSVLVTSLYHSNTSGSSAISKLSTKMSYVSSQSYLLSSQTFLVPSQTYSGSSQIYLMQSEELSSQVQSLSSPLLSFIGSSSKDILSSLSRTFISSTQFPPVSANSTSKEIQPSLDYLTSSKTVHSTETLWTSSPVADRTVSITLTTMNSPFNASFTTSDSRLSSSSVISQWHGVSASSSVRSDIPAFISSSISRIASAASVSSPITSSSLFPSPMSERLSTIPSRKTYTSSKIISSISTAGSLIAIPSLTTTTVTQVSSMKSSLVIPMTSSHVNQSISLKDSATLKPSFTVTSSGSLRFPQPTSYKITTSTYDGKGVSVQSSSSFSDASFLIGTTQEAYMMKETTSSVFRLTSTVFETVSTTDVISSQSDTFDMSSLAASSRAIYSDIDITALPWSRSLSSRFSDSSFLTSYSADTLAAIHITSDIPTFSTSQSVTSRYSNSSSPAHTTSNIGSTSTFSDSISPTVSTSNTLTSSFIDSDIPKLIKSSSEHSYIAASIYDSMVSTSSPMATTLTFSSVISPIDSNLKLSGLYLSSTLFTTYTVTHVPELAKPSSLTLSFTITSVNHSTFSTSSLSTSSDVSSSYSEFKFSRLSSNLSSSNIYTDSDVLDVESKFITYSTLLSDTIPFISTSTLSSSNSLTVLSPSHPEHTSIRLGYTELSYSQVNSGQLHDITTSSVATKLSVSDSLPTYVEGISKSKYSSVITSSVFSDIESSQHQSPSIDAVTSTSTFSHPFADWTTSEGGSFQTSSRLYSSRSSSYVQVTTSSSLPTPSYSVYIKTISSSDISSLVAPSYLDYLETTRSSDLSSLLTTSYSFYVETTSSDLSSLLTQSYTVDVKLATLSEISSLLTPSYSTFDWTSSSSESSSLLTPSYPTFVRTISSSESSSLLMPSYSISDRKASSSDLSSLPTTNYSGQFETTTSSGISSLLTPSYSTIVRTISSSELSSLLTPSYSTIDRTISSSELSSLLTPSYSTFDRTISSSELSSLLMPSYSTFVWTTTSSESSSLLSPSYSTFVWTTTSSESSSLLSPSYSTFVWTTTSSESSSLLSPSYSTFDRTTSSSESSSLLSPSYSTFVWTTTSSESSSLLLTSYSTFDRTASSSGLSSLLSPSYSTFVWTTSSELSSLLTPSYSTFDRTVSSSGLSSLLTPSYSTLLWSASSSELSSLHTQSSSVYTNMSIESSVVLTSQLFLPSVSSVSVSLTIYSTFTPSTASGHVTKSDNSTSSGKSLTTLESTMPLLSSVNISSTSYSTLQPTITSEPKSYVTDISISTVSSLTFMDSTTPLSFSVSASTLAPSKTSEHSVKTFITDTSIVSFLTHLGSPTPVSLSGTLSTTIHSTVSLSKTSDLSFTNNKTVSSSKSVESTTLLLPSLSDSLSLFSTVASSKSSDQSLHIHVSDTSGIDLESTTPLVSSRSPIPSQIYTRFTSFLSSWSSFETPIFISDSVLNGSSTIKPGFTSYVTPIDGLSTRQTSSSIVTIVSTSVIYASSVVELSSSIYVRQTTQTKSDIQFTTLYTNNPSATLASSSLTSSFSTSYLYRSSLRMMSSELTSTTASTTVSYYMVNASIVTLLPSASSSPLIPSTSSELHVTATSTYSDLNKYSHGSSSNSRFISPSSGSSYTWITSSFEASKSGVTTPPIQSFRSSVTPTTLSSLSTQYTESRTLSSEVYLTMPLSSSAYDYLSTTSSNVIPSFVLGHSSLVSSSSSPSSSGYLVTSQTLKYIDTFTLSSTVHVDTHSLTSSHSPHVSVIYSVSAFVTTSTLMSHTLTSTSSLFTSTSPMLAVTSPLFTSTSSYITSASPSFISTSRSFAWMSSSLSLTSPLFTLTQGTFLSTLSTFTSTSSWFTSTSDTFISTSHLFTSISHSLAPTSPSFTSTSPMYTTTSNMLTSITSQTLSSSEFTYSVTSPVLVHNVTSSVSTAIFSSMVTSVETSAHVLFSPSSTGLVNSTSVASSSSLYVSVPVMTSSIRPTRHTPELPSVSTLSTSSVQSSGVRSTTPFSGPTSLVISPGIETKISTSVAVLSTTSVNKSMQITPSTSATYTHSVWLSSSVATMPTTTEEPRATTANVTNVREAKWVKTVLKLPKSTDITDHRFRTDIEQRLAEAYDEAFIRQKLFEQGKFEPLEKRRRRRRRRKRYSTVGDASVHIQDITRVGSTSSVEVSYSIANADVILTSSEAVDALDMLDAQELAIILKQVVASKVKPYIAVERTEETDESSKIFLIAVIAAPIAAVIIIIWIVVCVYFKVCRSKERQHHVDDPELLSIGRHQERSKESIRSYPSSPNAGTSFPPKKPARLDTRISLQQTTSNPTSEGDSAADDRARKASPTKSYDKIPSRPTSGKPRVNGSVVMETSLVTEVPMQSAVPTSADSRRDRKKSGKRSQKNSVEPLPVPDTATGRKDKTDLSDTQGLLSDSVLEDNEELQERRRVERRKNKERLREKRRKERGIESYVTAQNELNRVLGMPNTSVPNMFIEEGTLKKSVSRQDSGVFNGTAPAEENLDEARHRMHKLLDQAFSLISPRASMVGNDSRHSMKTSSSPPYPRRRGSATNRDRADTDKPPSPLAVEYHVNPAYDPSDGLETWSPYRSSDNIALISMPNKPDVVVTKLGSKSRSDHATENGDASHKARPAANLERGVSAKSNYATSSAKPIVLRTKDLMDDDTGQPEVAKGHSRPGSKGGVREAFGVSGSMTSPSKTRSASGRKGDIIDSKSKSTSRRTSRDVTRQNNQSDINPTSRTEPEKTDDLLKSLRDELQNLKGQYDTEADINSKPIKKTNRRKNLKSMTDIV